MMIGSGFVGRVCHSMALQSRLGSAGLLRSSLRALGDVTFQRAVVLEDVGKLELKDEYEIFEPFTPDDVRISIATVGICRSDLTYYEKGVIGPFQLNQPMIVGHEASGIITEVGSRAADRGFKVGQRVCMEPGVPDFKSLDTLTGHYNQDKNVRFWATPPANYATQINQDPAWMAGHGCLRESVVHPAAFTFPLPDNVLLDHGALVEPLAVGMHAATEAKIKPGEKAVVIGGGPIGMMCVMTALAGGCSSVLLLDPSSKKVAIAETLGNGITGLDVSGMDEESIKDAVLELTEGGPNVVFECAGGKGPAALSTKYAANGARIIVVACHGEPIPLDVGDLQTKELHIQGLFRYANVYPAAINLLKTGRVNVAPLITKEWSFDDSVAAFDFALNGPPNSVKNIIRVNSDLV
eukprot:m.49463 g.49463  ORF g.49463 m.49463 type:complete len:409 (-) comp7453_c0_seq2:966-2192(-)